MMSTFTKKWGALAFAAIFSNAAIAQQSVPEGWHLKDVQADGYYGISVNKAYDFLKSKNKKSTPVVVGIIDSGIDTTHEDLKPVLWVNKNEIPGNGIDDDKNGYVDDIHGWNFLGGKDVNTNVEKDSFEGARVYWKNKNKYEGKTPAQITAAEKAEYEMWARAKAEMFKDQPNPNEIEQLARLKAILTQGDSLIQKALNKKTYTCKDLQSYTPTALAAMQMKEVMVGTCKGNNTDEISNKDLLGLLQKDIDKGAIVQSPPKNYRSEVVKDNYNDINDKFYGNNNVYVDNESAFHGTHVAGIIGAARNNGKGIDGVADNVKLMSIRAVPDGDEHDKDIALAIRYAVDNGAKVINMSFGKGYSPEKKWVDDAVKYAASKNVLLVHAAGNDAANVDTAFNFPSAEFVDGTRPTNWMTIGASGDPKAGGLTASFSNYGKKEVDVFAPGVRIYSTIPGGNTYGNAQGTSMASPVVAGLAALIMSYYPDLSAVQVKDIIQKSVSKPAAKVSNPGGGDNVLMSEISLYGGIVNAAEAIKLADSMSKGVQPSAIKKPATKKPVKKSTSKKRY